MNSAARTVRRTAPWGRRQGTCTEERIRNEEEKKQKMNRQQGNNIEARSCLGLGELSSSMLGPQIYLNALYRVNGVYMNIYLHIYP